MLVDGPQPNRVEIEIARRERIVAAAYAYEIMSESFMTDAQYDAQSKLINPAIDTGDEVSDRFFREKFAEHTGSWIYEYPDLHKVRHLYFTKYASPYYQKRYAMALDIGEKMHRAYQDLANRHNLEKSVALDRFDPTSPHGQLMASTLMVLDEENYLRLR